MNKKGSVNFNITGKVILGVLLFLLLIIAFIFPRVRVFLIGLALLGVALLIAVNGKLNRTRSIFVVMFLALGLVIIFFGNAFVSNTELVGSSTLGLQQVQYFSSSDACFNSGSPSNLWVYTVRGGGLGQSATGSYTPTEAGDLYSGSTEPAKTFTITETYNQYCDYPIVPNPSATPVYQLASITVWNIPLLVVPSVSECGKEAPTQKDSQGNLVCNGGAGYIYGLLKTPLLSQAKCYCSQYTKQSGAVGSVLNLANPVIRTNMTIKVSSGTDVSTRSFSSDNDVEGQIGSNVCAVWQGNLVTGQTCGLPSIDTIPVYYGSSTGGNWNLVSKDVYDTYKIAYSTLLTTLNAGNLDEATVRAKITTFQQTSDAVKNSQVSFGTINNPTSQAGAIITKTLNNLIQFPVTTMYVKANWLGVITPVPQAKITQNPTSECFPAGANNGQITLKVQDVGEGGDINVFGTCGKGFTITSDEQSYEAGEEKTITLVLSGTSNETTTNATCKITAKALDQSVSQNVDVCATGYPTCTREGNWCEGDNIVYCPNTFSAITVLTNCALQGETCNTDNGTAHCKSNNPDQKCGDGTCNNGETQASCPADCCPIGGCGLQCDTKTPKIFGYQEVTSQSQTLWSVIGLAKPKETNWCKPTNEPYIIGGVLVLIMGLSSLFIFKSKKKIKGRKSSKYGKIGK